MDIILCLLFVPFNTLPVTKTLSELRRGLITTKLTPSKTGSRWCIKQNIFIYILYIYKNILLMG